MKKIAYLFLLLFIILGCRDKSPETGEKIMATGADKPAYGDALITGSIGEPSILIPMLAGDSASHEIAGPLFLTVLSHTILTSALSVIWQSHGIFLLTAPSSLFI